MDLAFGRYTPPVRRVTASTAAEHESPTQVADRIVAAIQAQRAAQAKADEKPEPERESPLAQAERFAAEMRAAQAKANKVIAQQERDRIDDEVADRVVAWLRSKAAR